ncbi:MAG: NAD(P)/FAD-dependent oxidoreductase [Mycobacteriales bacterium]
MAQRFVVVGGGLAGGKAVQTLRAEGFTGEVLLCTDEPEAPYERPPLSKALLLGDAQPDSVYVEPVSWYGERQVELRTNCLVTGLDPGAHELTLSTAETIGYSRLLLATGARPRKPTIPGAESPGVCYLRTLADSLRLRDLLRPDVRVVIVGAGWIGLETAAAARHHGAAVCLVEPQPTPLYAALGPELGSFYADVHREHGVELRLGTAAREILLREGQPAGVVVGEGEHLPADVVVVGVGAAPCTELAEAGGLSVSGGVLVDSGLQTSAPDVFAAGDVAAWQSQLLGRRLRVEHWANALNGGPAAARAMLGQQVSYDPVPYFFSDQYDLGMEFTGWVEPGGYDQVLYRGERSSAGFIAFWLRQGRVLAGMNVNVWDVSPAIEMLIRSGRTVDPRALADPDRDLTELAAG